MAEGDIQSGDKVILCRVTLDVAIPKRLRSMSMEMSSMSPDTAQFKDVLTLLQAPNFWQIVGVAAAGLIGLEVILAGGLSGPARTECYIGSGRPGSSQEAGIGNKSAAPQKAG